MLNSVAKKLQKNAQVQLSYKTVESRLFYLLLSLYLIPLWFVEYLPSQDGPAHLENAYILLNYFSDSAQHYQKFYYLNHWYEPTWLGHLVLAGLVFIFSPMIALKLFASLVLIALPISLRNVMSKLNSDSKFISLITLPFAYSLFFHMGFYSFCAGLAFYFFLLCYWLEKRKSLSRRNYIFLSFAALLFYYLHILVFAITLFSIAVIEFFFLLRDREYKDFATWFKRNAYLTLSSVPALSLVLLYLGAHHGKWGPTANLDFILIWLTNLGILQTYQSPLETLVVRSMFWILSFMGIYAAWMRLRQREPSRLDVFLILAMVLCGLALVFPDSIGNASVISVRFFMFFFLCYLLSLASAKYKQHYKVGVSLVAAAVSITFVFAIYQKHQQLDSHLQEFASLRDSIEPASTILPLSTANWGPSEDGKNIAGVVATFVHAIGYLAMERELINLSNYEARMSYFPLVYRDELNPYKHLADIKDMEATPPKVRIANYRENTSEKVDYVLLWGDFSLYSNYGQVRKLFEELTADYYFVKSSKPRGLVYLYKAK